MDLTFYKYEFGQNKEIVEGYIISKINKQILKLLYIIGKGQMGSALMGSALRGTFFGARAYLFPQPVKLHYVSVADPGVSLTIEGKPLLKKELFTREGNPFLYNNIVYYRRKSFKPVAGPGPGDHDSNNNSIIVIIVAIIVL